MERYESLGLVGEGSYGVVLKCRHRDSGRLVAIKKFVDSDGDKMVKKIALREIKLLRKLHHDNLVNLLEVWKRRRRWYLVFEFVERTLLDDLEQNPSGLDLNTTRQYLYQILRAAAFCHQQNIIHRDIKPENILVSQGGVVKICDFGFARTVLSPADGGVYTDYVATRWYRAPELLVGDLKYGKPVDVWAIGCLLLEMLTGQPLFPGDSELDQIYHITRCFGNLTALHRELFQRNPVFSSARLPECSGQVTLQERFPTITPTALDLAQSCLQMDPEGRPPCSELLEHPLFTQDSFHTRFLDELNAKIKKDHRQNSTLPKITKTPRRRTGEQLETMDEKVKEMKGGKPEEKMEKKGKQTSKFSKTMANTSETSFTSLKQSKALGTKVTDDASRASVAVKSTPEKNTDVELKKELEICKIDKNWSTKVSTLSKISATERPNVSLSPKASLESYIYRTENNVACQPCQSSESDQTEAATQSVPSVSKQPKTSTTSEHQSSATSPKTLKVLDKEIRDDFSLSVSNSPKPLMSQSSKVHGSKSTGTPQPRASARSFILHNVDVADELDFTVPYSSPPPSSTALTPSSSVVSTNTPGVNLHLSLGTGFHPGNHSLRCIDKPRNHGSVYSRLAQQSMSSHITPPVAAQVSDKSLVSERPFPPDRCSCGVGGGIAVAKKKSEIHFPDLRSPVLPELRGRDGKHNKGVSRGQRKDRRPVPHISPSDPQTQQD